MRQIARGSDEFHEPVTVDMSPDGEVAVIEVPLAGTGTDDTSMARRRVAPRRRRAAVPPACARPGGRRDRLHRRLGDFNNLMSSRIWFVFGFVFRMAFLLLLVIFRSIVIPLKAIALNLLSAAAALGIVSGVPGRQPRGAADLPRHGGDHGGAPDHAVRDPVRPVDGLPRVPPQPHQGGPGPAASAPPHAVVTASVHGRCGDRRGDRWCGLRGFRDASFIDLSSSAWAWA